MKKTMLFNSGEEYEIWSDKNEEKEGGFDFLADRTCIIAGTRKRNGKTFKGFEAFATYYCKSELTAIRRFVKSVKEAGFGNLDDDFECGDESNCNCYEDCGYVVCVEGEDGCWNIGYICYQDEVTEEENIEETEETVEIKEEKILEELKSDCIRKAVESYKAGTPISVQGLYKKTQTGIKTVIVDNYKLFEYYINRGYVFYCTPNITDIIKNKDPEFWHKFKNG